MANVPGYSPWAVAEHAVALLLTLNRKIHKVNTLCRGRHKHHPVGLELDGCSIRRVPDSKARMHRI